VATNKSTANFLMDSGLVNNEYQIEVPDYAGYLADRTKFVN
jgi:methylglyoxal synthase